MAREAQGREQEVWLILAWEDFAGFGSQLVLHSVAWCVGRQPQCKSQLATLIDESIKKEKGLKEAVDALK